MIACRPTSLNAICCALCRAVAAIGIADATESGIIHRPFECLHPAHRPAGHAEQTSMPRWSISIFCKRAMSRIVITGKLMA